MKASFIQSTKKNVISAFHKEKHFTNEYALIDLNGPEYNKVPIKVRFYKTANTTYCCMFGSAVYGGHGGDKASGYNLNRELSAIEKAFKDAGIIFDKDVNDIYEALKAVAELLGVEKYYIHHAHA